MKSTLCIKMNLQGILIWTKFIVTYALIRSFSSHFKSSKKVLLLCTNEKMFKMALSIITIIVKTMEIWNYII